jgi:hydroxylamine reductase
MDSRNIAILESAGMGCVGCPASQSESLNDACMVHGMNSEAVLAMLNGAE